MTYNVFGGTLNLAQFNSIQFNSVSDSRVYNLTLNLTLLNLQTLTLFEPLAKNFRLVGQCKRQLQ